MQTFSSLYPVSLCFLRHAKAESGYADFSSPLSLEGKQQARALKEVLQAFHFDLALVSPAIRTKETLELAIDPIPTIEMPSLYHLLHNAGLILMQRQAGGKYPEGLQKIYQEIDSAIRQAKAKSVLIVAHSGVINLLGALFCKEHEKEISHLAIDNGDGFILKPLS